MHYLMGIFHVAVQSKVLLPGMIIAHSIHISFVGIEIEFYFLEQNCQF